MAVEQPSHNTITIFIQPGLASDSAEVGAIYDYLAQLLPYDKGKLKDRFPDIRAVKTWCDSSPKAVHRRNGCLALDPIGENGVADF